MMGNFGFDRELKVDGRIAIHSALFNRQSRVNSCKPRKTFGHSPLLIPQVRVQLSGNPYMLVWAQTPELSAEFRGMFMSLRTRLALPAIVSALAALAGCGGSSNPTVTPPPSGGFANSNLSGQYVFSVTGSDTSGNFITLAGTFNADGNGNISSSGGVVDANGTGGVVAAEAPITSGTYIVGTDGRPTGSANTPIGLLTLQAGGNTFTFDYVLTSGEHGLITEFDGFGSASGTLDLQSSVAQSDINGQSFAFNFTGSSGFANLLCGFSFGTPVPAPYTTVGAFTLDSNGNISSGLEDINNNCSWSGPPNLTVTSGAVSVGSPFGTASIASTIAGNATTYSFDVFPIDATHLKFVEMDANAVTVGDAFTQQSSVPSGNTVFTVSGFDNNSSFGGPFTAAGILNTDGTGTITSSSVQDINDSFVASEVTSITGTYSAVTGGRSQITLSGFVNGNGGTGCSACLFAAYPSSGGLQLIEIDGLGITSGVAYAQAASPALATGEGYGMNLSGVFLQSGGFTNSEDDIAEFTNNNGTFGPGIIDFNDQGTLAFKNTFQSSYAADTTVPGRGTVTPSNNGYLLTTYTIDSTTTVAVSTDPSYVALGAIVKQNATAKSNAAAAHLAVLRAANAASQRAKRRLKR
jgi:hypothetical protein